MEKNLTVDEIKQTILNGIKKAMDDHGLDIVFSVEDLLGMFPDGVKMGRLGLALQDLKAQNSVVLDAKNNKYRMPVSVYKEYVASEDSEANGVSGPWRPIQVEDYEEVAGEIEEFSAEIKAENGLKVSHPDETEFVTETADAMAKSLRDKEGVITRKRLSTLIDGVHRILEICDKTTRIGKVIHAFIEFIKPFL